jgi:hypothetical protein
MKNYKKKSYLKKISIKLIDEFKEDKNAELLNNNNEKILTKQIKKIIKKNTLKPINTRCLLKNPSISNLL